MSGEVFLDEVYVPSQDVVARLIEGEIIIIPLVTGIGDLEDELYSLNETGRSIWEKLDGKKNLKSVVDELCTEFDGAFQKTIEADVLGFVKELVGRRMLVRGEQG